MVLLCVGECTPSIGVGVQSLDGCLTIPDSLIDLKVISLEKICNEFLNKRYAWNIVLYQARWSEDIDSWSVYDKLVGFAGSIEIPIIKVTHIDCI